MSLRISVADVEPRRTKAGPWVRFSVNFTRVEDGLVMGTNKGWTYSTDKGVVPPRTRSGFGYYDFWDTQKEWRQEIQGMLLSYEKVRAYVGKVVQDLPEIDVPVEEEFLDR